MKKFIFVIVLVFVSVSCFAIDGNYVYREDSTSYYEVDGLFVFQQSETMIRVIDRYGFDLYIVKNDTTSLETTYFKYIGIIHSFGSREVFLGFIYGQAVYIEEKNIYLLED